ncbi:MAG: hypothetical protein GWN07_02000 [Actinobacteria bacterium]|nr:hypothetical protein [Actinomycetota bacterium]NIW26108.1 hypothetical protein [Actinomycetota bacterium]NIX18678.1 hypothetical protein [Actinomycetota bacterium]
MVPDESDFTHYLFETFPEAVLPVDGAILPSSDEEAPPRFTTVETGATLVFGVRHLDVRAATLRTEGWLELRGPAGEVLDRGRLLILGEQSCSVRPDRRP